MSRLCWLAVRQKSLRQVPVLQRTQVRSGACACGALSAKDTSIVVKDAQLSQEPVGQTP